jgi:hypothetical protein
MAAPTRNPDSRHEQGHDNTEQTPLLRETEDTQDQQDEDKPLPIRQMLLLCYARIMEPITFFSIFPYITQMVKINGNLPASDVGFYSGLMECAFQLPKWLS